MIDSDNNTDSWVLAKVKTEDCIEGITKTIGKEKSIGRFIKGIGS